ncbi:MAG: VWA domain-containing protein [Odoribacter sp.]|nr:VWA domain-containing protein [Odoribacter sp.]
MSGVFAAEIDGKDEYKPLDMVVIVDTSGSMNYSDSTHMTSSAINMLVNMMPAEDSRIGIVTFNTKPTSVTVDSSGNPTLLDLSNLDNVKNIREKVSEIVYKGDTGIGNAVKMATDILAENSKDDSRQKAIILFTDGLDDFGADQLSLAKCKENQGTAVQWATNNDCPIYCIGYNYQTSSGANSMGENGEGITKLENISKPTNGQAKAITSIDEIEDMFINMLANICDLYYKVIETVPGDGQRHEVSIPISPEVIEANIRITCPTNEALSKGEIELYNPNNEEVALQNSSGVRYDVDATAASIKVLSPKTGTWKLVLDGVNSEEIKIGLLEHYELGIVSKLTLPDGNPQDTAYVGDQIGVQAYLTTDGIQISDVAIYETIKDARVIVTPRAAPENEKVYALSFDGTIYTGSFTIPQESVYDVTVEIESESFIRSDNLVIQSGNHPLVLNKEFEDVKLNKNKQIVVKDIYTYVSDIEQDTITAQITNSTDPDMANAAIKDDTIVIDGLKWGATNVTVTFTDEQGNVVNSTFKVSVNDPVMLSIYIGIFLLIVILILLLLYWLYRKTFKITGKVRVLKLAEAVDNNGMEPDICKLLFESNYSFDMTERPKKSKRFGEFKTASDKGDFGTAETGFVNTNGGLRTTKTGFGSLKGGFGSSTGGFTTSDSGLGKQNSGFGKSNGGFSNNSGGGFSSSKGEFGNPRSTFGTQPEEFIETVDESKFNGEMELAVILENEQNLFKVLEAFAGKYEKYMTTNGTVESQKAKNIKSFINQLSRLRDAKIGGSSAGLRGLQIKLPKKVPIKSHSLKIERFKIKTNVNNGKFVTIKLSIPLGEEKGKKLCYYLEVEYKN